MRNARGHNKKMKMSGSEKKVNKKTYELERLRFTFTAYGKRQTSLENFSE